VGPDYDRQDVFLYKNGSSVLKIALLSSMSSDLSALAFWMLHLDAGDTLQLRLTIGEQIEDITLNIELTGQR